MDDVTVKELIKALKTLPQNAKVVMASDGEGNSFNAFYQVSKEPMRAEQVGGYRYEYHDSAGDVVVLWPKG